MSSVLHTPAPRTRSPGEEMFALAARLFPICRSLTGNGVRATLEILRERLPLVIREVPSGTRVLDSIVPKEWNIRDAYVANVRGERVIDFRRHNLHIVQYSAPVRARMTLDALRPRLHTIPDRPDAIPYRTSYYNESWGFCLTDRRLQGMPPGEYEVVIDATLRDGRLTYGELFLPGTNGDKVLFHTQISHPSLANDNLSGIVVTAWLAAHLLRMPLDWSYRFLFLPGLIGPVTWLAQNQSRINRIRHGLVLTGLGDPGPLTYKPCRTRSAEIDRVMEHLLAHGDRAGRLFEFEPCGCEERQYWSPGLNLPIGTLMRTPPGSYPEYHTSDDNLDFIRPDRLEEALTVLIRLVQVLETDRTCRNLAPYGTPLLDRRGLFYSNGGASLDERHRARLWALNLSDGTRSLLDVANRSGLAFGLIEQCATELEEANLLETVRTAGDV